MTNISIHNVSTVGVRIIHFPGNSPCNPGNPEFWVVKLGISAQRYKSEGVDEAAELSLYFTEEPALLSPDGSAMMKIPEQDRGLIG